MPCPHFSCSIVSRKNASSAVAAAAYQSGEKLFSEYDQQTKHYRKKEDEIVHTEIMLPGNAPPEYTSRETLWNSVESVEQNWNSQLARKLIISLPAELSMEENTALIREYCREQFLAKGMIVDLSMHDPPPANHNPHAHILLTMRALDENGRWMPKGRKEYVLDKNGDRVRLPNGNYKTYKVPTTGWDDRGNVARWREAWGEIQNRYLERAGCPELIDMRSYEKQGIGKIPTVHMGPAVAHMEEKGIRTNIGDLNRDIRKTNRLLQTIRKTIRSLTEWIAELHEKRKLYREYLSERKQQPVLGNLLLEYYQLRIDERNDWSSSAKLNGMVKDSEKVIHCKEYLDARGLYVLDDLHAYLSALEEKRERLMKEIRPAERRMKDIAQIRTARKTIGELQPVHEAYMKKNFKKAKEKYAVAHDEELKKYNSAYRFLKKMESKGPVDPESLKAEYRELELLVEEKSVALEQVKADLKELSTVRYFISRVHPEEAEPDTVSIHDRVADANLKNAVDRSQKTDKSRDREEKQMWQKPSRQGRKQSRDIE